MLEGLYEVGRGASPADDRHSLTGLCAVCGRHVVHVVIVVSPMPILAFPANVSSKPILVDDGLYNTMSRAE